MDLFIIVSEKLLSNCLQNKMCMFVIFQGATTTAHVLLSVCILYSGTHKILTAPLAPCTKIDWPASALPLKQMNAFNFSMASLL